jgi:hypothetical protein
MWPFNRKKKDLKPGRAVLTCTFCRSNHTVLKTYHGGEQPDPVKTWRGQRYLTCRCLDCGADFYVEEPRDGLPPDITTDENMIDEDMLTAAEDKLKKQTEDEDNHMFR